LDSNHWLDSTVKADQQYTLTAQALHWITAVLMFTVLPVAWVMMNMPETAHARGLLFTLHKSIGLSIVMLVAIRLTWRAMHPAPPLTGGLSRWEKGAAISGYLLDATGGYPISYFGLFSVPVLSKIPMVANLATWVHVAVGQWLVYALILLHVAATVWHVTIRRDGVLNRMLPEQAERG